MYSETKNYVSFFRAKIEGTDKCAYGNLSVKVGEHNGEPKYNSWLGKFVGQAFSNYSEDLKDGVLCDGVRLEITKWKATNDFSRNTGKNYPCIVVFDYEIAPPFEDNKKEDAPSARRR
jgi:hypothetical protein